MWVGKLLLFFYFELYFKLLFVLKMYEHNVGAMHDSITYATFGNKKGGPVFVLENWNRKQYFHFLFSFYEKYVWHVDTCFVF